MSTERRDEKMKKVEKQMTYVWKIRCGSIILPSYSPIVYNIITQQAQLWKRCKILLLLEICRQTDRRDRHTKNKQQTMVKIWMKNWWICVYMGIIELLRLNREIKENQMFFIWKITKKNRPPCFTVTIFLSIFSFISVSFIQCMSVQ